MLVEATSCEEFSWNSDTIYALGLYRKIGRALGIWPLKYFNIFSYIQLAFIVILPLWMSTDLIQQLSTKGYCGTLIDLVDVLTFICVGFLSAIKVITLKIREHNVYVVGNSAVEDWAKVMDKKSRDIMLKYATIGRTIFIIQMVGIYTASIPLFMVQLPFITDLWRDHTNSSMMIRRVPVGPNCWLSPDLSTFNYVGYYMVQCVQLLITCTSFIGNEAYFFGFAMHFCGQFELLSMSIEDLDKIKNNFDQKSNINGFSKRHNQLLNLVEHFENIFNIIILADVGSDTLMVCISGIVLLTGHRSSNFMIIGGLIIRIYLICIQLFMYSYVGEILSEKADKLQVAIYNISWYNMTPDLVKDMSFIIMRCNYPFNLTAGKVYIMNLSNFKNIMKAMGSYFSVLRLMIVDQ